MKLLIVLALVAMAVARPGDLFNIEPSTVQEAKDNPRLLRGYANCLLGKGPCTKQGKDLKQLVPNTIHDSCGKCSANDKVNAATLLKAVQTKIPEEFEALLKQYDPSVARRAELDQFMSQNAS